MVEVTMRMTMWIIYVAPVGIIFLIAGQIIAMKNPAETFEQIAAYFGTVIAALFIHGLTRLRSEMLGILGFRIKVNATTQAMV